MATSEALPSRATSLVECCHWRAVWTALRWLAFVVLLVPSLLHDSPSRSELRTEQAAQPLSFNLVEWEVARLSERLGNLVAALRGEPAVASPADIELIRTYFQTPPGGRAALRSQVEPAIERLVADAWRTEGLAVASPLAAGQPIVFPPVSFTFTAPPEVLVVSPRDRIEVTQSVLLRPSLQPSEVVQLEAGVARRSLSTLVTPISGLATYPAMVLDTGSAQATLSAVAHEWVHGYLFFRPLGRDYWSDPAARIVNETAAELAGNELGAGLTEQLGLPVVPPSSAPNPRQVEFNTLLRRTRLETDRLLGLGQVEEAERYMEARRQELNSRGFGIRRLNQAYFAFYGSYAEGPAGSSPLAGRVRSLREASPSLGVFLQTIAQGLGP
jgi:hypothetical protein